MMRIERCSVLRRACRGWRVNGNDVVQYVQVSVLLRSPQLLGSPAGFRVARWLCAPRGSVHASTGVREGANKVGGLRDMYGREEAVRFNQQKGKGRRRTAAGTGVQCAANRRGQRGVQTVSKTIVVNPTIQQTATHAGSGPPAPY